MSRDGQILLFQEQVQIKVLVINELCIHWYIKLLKNSLTYAAYII